MTEPDYLALANRLDERADVLERLAGCPIEASDIDRAAAAALRTLHQLTNAIGDPERLLTWAVYYDGATLPPWLRSLAAAVSPPPAPTCPNCGSAERRTYRCDHGCQPGSAGLADPWHQETT